MDERGGELSDEDVEVTEVDWVALDELEERLAYADERRLVLRALELLDARPARTGDTDGDPGRDTGQGAGDGNRPTRTGADAA